MSGEERTGNELLGELSCLDISTDPDVLEGYRRDAAAYEVVPAGMPLALVRPRTTAEVRMAVQAAGRHGVSIVPRGAGTGLSGGANALDGCLILCTERMTRIIDLDCDSLTATVQAGVVNAELSRAVVSEGLRYAPDPASWEQSTIGGNVATNAGGLCCLKYGVTRDSLLGVEAVLADGSVVRAGRRTRKGVAGYDLTGLLCGSEGTLAIITEATVRLQVRPGLATAMAASFSTLRDAAESIVRIVRRSRPSLLEIIDHATVAAVERFQPMDLDADAAAMVFAQSDEAGGRIEAEWMARCCKESGASIAVTSEDEAEGRMLLAARRLAYPALERSGSTLLDDVAVPLAAVSALIDGVERIASTHGVQIATFGHAGDGNMHPTIVYDRTDAEESARALRAFDAIIRLAVDLGGTITGEHGVGLLKRAYLEEELGVRVGTLNAAIKQALDPAGLLNPGKAI